ncbi:Rossmann-fold NAD(P)-binding domain-containing protein [Streptomyces kanamyceticus]|uniref:hypothetical protein n=1 Tax=Streptomyces kanamyceticus TaxID=1967 RepID=UPI00123DEB1D|nr:hypothetical protein [Streptomyces kanamyceticus]
MAHALVVGGGIAGDTLALLMERDGWTVTVAEIAPALRSGGQTVDLRGDSRAVLERAGLLQQALDCLVPQRGAAWIDARGGVWPRCRWRRSTGAATSPVRSCCAPTSPGSCTRRPGPA